MTDEIGNFEAKNLWERGAALVGDKAERMNTVKFLVGSWTNSDGALIICDGDGSLYSQYGGGGLLVDFLSANSVVPDVCTPIVRHRRYGRSSRESARLIGDIVVRERQDRTSNDQFWTMSGRQTMLEYIEYSLLIAYIAKRDECGTGNALLDFSNAHGMLAPLMDRLVSHGSEETERWELKTELMSRAGNVLSKRREREPKALTETEFLLHDLLIHLYGDNAVPFHDTLASYSKGVQTNTTNCILRTARAMGGALFEFNRQLSEEIDYYDKLGTLDLSQFVRAGEVPDGSGTAENEEPTTPNIMFLVNGSDKDVSSAAALLTLVGCAAAADCEKKKITCLIPDIAHWNIIDGLTKLKHVFPGALNLVVGCSDFIRAARSTDMSPMLFFDSMAGLANDSVLWHRSQDVFLKDAFRGRSSGTALMYGITDLGPNGLAAIERGGEISYLYVPQAGESGVSPGIRAERVYDDTKQKFWWDAESKPRLQFEEPKKDEKTGVKLYISPEADAMTDAIWGGGDDEEQN